jgi:hypothetical protein
MIDRDHELPIKRQTELLGLSRARRTTTPCRSAKLTSH